jgi:hypothetical protein
VTTLSPTDVAAVIKQVAASHNDNLSKISLATATSIVMAESSGDTLITHKNNDGSIDRGMWQFNDKAHPTLSDTQAFDPVASTEYAYTISKGFTVDGMKAVWHDGKGKPSKGLDGAYVLITARQLGIDLGGSPLDTVSTAANSVFSAVTPDWVSSAGKVLGNLLNGTWWKRIGIGALGVIIVLIALILLFGKDVEKGISPV